MDSFKNDRHHCPKTRAKIIREWLKNNCFNVYASDPLYSALQRVIDTRVHNGKLQVRYLGIQSWDSTEEVTEFLFQ